VISLDKNLIREELLDIRGKLGKDEHEKKSRQIIKALMDSNLYKESNNIMVFISFKNEIDTHEFIKKAIEDGKNIFVPITIPDGKKLKPSQLKSFDELEPGFYNILTPKKEFIRFIDPKDLDLIVVPGLGFDKSGYRVGFGGGYYDRFLSGLKNAKKVSIAFDFQILDEVPKESFDIPVDCIYTEKRKINCK
jgi:5-formyltetrahydrofolate cyclo-ligase